MGMAERIKERRIAMGFTQEELASKLGLQKSAIAKYENGRVENIKRSVIMRMSIILECSPTYLLGWDNLPPSDTEKSYIEPEYADMAKILQEKGLSQNDFIKILRIYDAFNAEDNN